MLNIKKELEENKILLVVIPNISYKDTILSISRQISQLGDVCYISLNKTSKALKNLLKEKNINCNKFFYIDCISRTMGKTKEERDYIFVSSPNAINEIGLAAEKARAKKPRIVIFDSLSTLLVYHKDSTATQFSHSLINNIRNEDIFAIFTVLEKDKETSLSKDMGMLVDKVLNVG